MKTFKRLKKILFSIFFFCFSLSLFPQAPAQCTDVMLQAFYWDSYNDTRWTNLLTQVDELSESFDLVWLPPSGKSSGMGYMPQYYFNQNSTFGTEADLKNLIAAFKAKGTRSIADIVINHRNGVGNWTYFPPETYKGITYTWGPETICSGDEVKDQAGQAKPTGNADTGENYDSARDIDHTNENVRNTIKAYLDFMKNEMGYDGWRYDLTKGFHGRYVAEYNNAAEAYFSVGEYWDGNYNLCWNWIKNAQYTSTTFDFPLKYRINSAFKGNLAYLNSGGLIHQNQSKRYAVTFVDNHDTGRDNNKFTGNILAANAYILSSPGVPCVWLTHWKSYKEDIKPMIAARKAAGIHSESDVVVHAATKDLYAATITGKHGKLYIRIGKDSYETPAGFNLVAGGTDYAIYANVQVAAPPVITVSPVGGTYVGGTIVTLTATQNAGIYYTLNGSTPSSASTRYVSPIAITTDNTVLKVIAIGENGKQSGVVTHTYKTVKGDPIIVKWKNDLNWTGNMYLYAWDDNDSPVLGQWPGRVVTAGSDGWYSYAFENEESVNIIFNNNIKQTVDIKNITSSTCFQILTQTEDTKHKYARAECPPSGLGEPKVLFSIYPTITGETLHISCDEVVKNITIYNINGQMVTEIYKPGKVISVSGLLAGTYFISLNTAKGISRYQKFFKK